MHKAVIAIILGLSVIVSQEVFAATPNRSKAVSVEKLIDQWELANEDCRGGSGDDPATEAACSHREQLAEQLKEQGLCFGRKKQSHSDYEWHKCAKDSVK